MEMNNEKYSELVSKIIDGEASGLEEQDLYSELSNNTDLQAELSENLRIKDVMAKDIEVYIPPTESKAYILGAIGLAAAPVAATGFMANFANMMRAWSGAGAAAIVAVAIGTAVYFNQFDLNSSSKTNNSTPKETQKDNSTFLPPSKNNIPMTVSNEVESEDAKPAKANRSSKKANSGKAKSGNASTISLNRDNNAMAAQSEEPVIANKNEDLAENNIELNSPKNEAEQIAPATERKELASLTQAELAQNNDLKVGFNTNNSTPNNFGTIALQPSKKGTGNFLTELNYSSDNTYQVGFRFMPHSFNVLGMNIKGDLGAIAGSRNSLISFTYDPTDPSSVQRSPELQAIWYAGVSEKLLIGDAYNIEFLQTNLQPTLQLNSGFANKGFFVNPNVGLELGNLLNSGASLNVSYNIFGLYQTSSKVTDTRSGLMVGVSYNW